MKEESLEIVDPSLTQAEVSYVHARIGLNTTNESQRIQTVHDSYAYIKTSPLYLDNIHHFKSFPQSFSEDSWSGRILVSGKVEGPEEL